MEQKKWKLGDLEFDSEQEYQDAAKDLKKIKQIMEEHDITRPDEARIVLREISEQPVFVSSYGLKFVEKLERTAAEAAPEEKKTTVSTASQKKPDKKASKSGKKIHIITKRNICIGAVLILLIIAGRIGWPYISPYFGGSNAEKGEDVRRNLVLAYAKNQVELQNEFYNYYKNVLGEEAEAALASANAKLSESYCINLADENVSEYTDEQIEDIYVKLITAGELVNNSFNEPQDITDLKATIAQASASGTPGSDVSEDTADTGAEGADVKVSLINKMMDYQQRTAAQLSYSYSQFDFPDSEVVEYVSEDMEAMFGQIIYDLKLSDADKETYYSVFQDAGLFSGGSLVRFSTNPIEYNLPDLTPTIELCGADGTENSVSCSQQTIAPVANVAYELHDGSRHGYLILRANGTGIGFVQDDDGNSVTTQGDFFLNWNGTITSGEWYYNATQIGFLVDDEKAGGIRYVYELVYQ